MDGFEECACDEADKYKIGHVIRELHGAFGKKFMACGMEAGLDEVTLMHGWIMGYLHHNQPVQCDFNSTAYGKERVYQAVGSGGRCPAQAAFSHGTGNSNRRQDKGDDRQYGEQDLGGRRSRAA